MTYLHTFEEIMFIPKYYIIHTFSRQKFINLSTKTSANRIYILYGSQEMLGVFFFFITVSGIIKFE